MRARLGAVLPRFWDSAASRRRISPSVETRAFRVPLGASRLFKLLRDFETDGGLAPRPPRGYYSGVQREALRVRAARKHCGREIMIVKDANGAQLADGDNVTLVKDLKVKGSSITLKRGALVKNIRLTDNEDEIECRSDKIKGLVLRTEFVKKA
jgi:protein PhnA